MTRFRPGLCTVTFRQLGPEDVVALAAECGIEGIECAGDVHVPPGQLAVAQRVRALTEQAGLAVISYGSYVAPPNDDERAFAAVLETAQSLGAPNIRIWPGSRNRDSASYSADQRLAVAHAIRRMAAMADEASRTISLEYQPGSLTDDLQTARRLMSEIDDPNVFLYWQPSPGLRLETALEEIRAVGPETSHVHVFAWDRERNRYPLADHKDQWRTILKAMPETRWRGERFAMLEFVKGDTPDQFREDAATFRQLLEEVRPAETA